MRSPLRSPSGCGTGIGGRSTEVASSGSCPLITLSTRPESATVREKTEMQSSDDPKATSP